MKDKVVSVAKLPRGVLLLLGNGKKFITTKDKCVVVFRDDGQDVIRESSLPKNYKHGDGTRISIPLTPGIIYKVVPAQG